MRFSVDPWDPAYGSVLLEHGSRTEPGRRQSSISSSPRRLASGARLPRRRAVARNAAVRRRRTSLERGTGSTSPSRWAKLPSAGIFASYAAGAVRCDGRARSSTSRSSVGSVHRAAGWLTVIQSRHGTFVVRRHGGAAPDVAIVRGAERMAVPRSPSPSGTRTGAADDLLVLDGPLRNRPTSPTRRHVKTHNVTLSAPRSRIGSSRLAARGAHTGVHVGTRRGAAIPRYLCLPGAADGPGPASSGARHRPIWRRRRWSAWPTG